MKDFNPKWVVIVMILGSVLILGAQYAMGCVDDCTHRIAVYERCKLTKYAGTCAVQEKAAMIACEGEKT